MLSRNIWVISDTHFGHENIIKYCDRTFSDTKEMNECIIDNWNSVVQPQDIIYHLGDVYMDCSGEEANSILKRLKGRKRLILGNHDDGKNKVLQNNFQKIAVWRMFTEYGLLLSHVPIDHNSLFRGKTGNEENPKKLLNVHGHIHNKESPSDDHRCICVEHTNYMPVNIEELRKW